MKQVLSRTRILLGLALVLGAVPPALAESAAAKRIRAQALRRELKQLRTKTRRLEGELRELEGSGTATRPKPRPASTSITTGRPQSEVFIGQVQVFAGNFAPRGWAFCDGQLLAISKHNALFSLLGTTYGGNGRTTFALPDLRGRAALHSGRGPGLADRRQGTRGGGIGLQSGAAGTHQIGQLGMRYIIAINGIYPSRS